MYVDVYVDISNVFGFQLGQRNCYSNINTNTHTFAQKCQNSQDKQQKYVVPFFFSFILTGLL